MEIWLFPLLIALAALAGLAKYLRSRARRRLVLLQDVLLGHEALAVHARELAKFHRVTNKLPSANLVKIRMAENQRFIKETYRNLNETARAGRMLPPASPWLLENYYIIEEQVAYVRQNYTSRDHRNLPQLASGPLRNFPRVYALALEMVSHSDGRLDQNTVKHFVASYQDIARLNTPELWSLPLFIRIALVENIRGICEQIRANIKEWNSIEAVLTHEDAVAQIDRWQQISPEQVEHLIKKSRIRPDKEGLQSALNKILKAQDTALEAMVREAHQAQSSRTITLGNSITSLKLVASLYWNDLFEALNPVDKILSNDRVYQEMDFQSRDWLRHRLEKLALKSRLPETRVARAALDCAQAEDYSDARERHTGWYIAGQGLPHLMKKLGKAYYPRPDLFPLYALAILSPAILSGGGIFVLSQPAGFITALVAALTGAIAVSEVFVSLVNWLAAHSFSPAFLPKLELRQGVPEELATMVVVPALLTNPRRAAELAGQLEIHWRANPDANLWFTLLGDFRDSVTERNQQDEGIVEAAQEVIRDLNRRHGDRFIFLHRKRAWSPRENRWLGRDRKRGILSDLNHLLTGGSPQDFVYREGQLPKVPIKYVLTLDADTRLPLNMARKLIGTIAHPMNQAKVQDTVVRQGYGLIQPRIGLSITSSRKTLFARAVAGQGGVDSYATSVSNAYQDMFGEGIFTGKGIYDVAVFTQVVEPAIPENTVLSHDLIEGILARTGLATDIELVDDFPVQTGAWLQRLHRWTRGDWQLLPWLWAKNINLLSRWKIADNLRRSLIHPSLVILLLLGFSVLDRGPVWAGLVLLTLTLPVLLDLTDRLLALCLRGDQGNITIGDLFRHWLISLALLPWRSWLQADAALRSLWRIFVTKKRLLEWTTAAEAEKNLGNDPAGFRKWGLFGLATSVILVVLAGVINPANLFLALGFALLWGLSPFLARAYSHIPDLKPEELKEEDTDDLRRLAFSTWRYYDDLANAEHNYLPPDNFQTYPPKGSDPRTSPTNIAFGLAAILCARDFGFITTSEMLERLAQVLATLEKMEKWHGHFYNWYDTQTLEVLNPRYVSTVDSGNLVGFLFALTEGLEEYRTRPILDDALLRNLAETSPLQPGDWTALLDQSNHGGEGSHLKKLWQNEADSLLWPDALVLPQEIMTQPAFANLLALAKMLRDDTSPQNLASTYSAILTEAERLLTMPIAAKHRTYLESLQQNTTRVIGNTHKLLRLISDLKERVEKLSSDHRFSMLYVPKRGLFSIGYNAESEALTDSYYDLLASEARLASYIAVARHEVPHKHWFRLGRAVTRSGENYPLVSWAGTMFEYLMPQLLLASYPGTLLDIAVNGALSAQISYGKARGVPWGISESGYYGFDMNLNYQYRAFGIPDLGLKRGLGDDVVVSPYSTLLALSLRPAAAMTNIKRLQVDGLEGRYGFYEAVDYTPDRLPKGYSRAVVRQYMAHHQGMGLVALNNFLNDGCMVKRFNQNPIIKSADLLLQERPPSRLILTKEIKEPVLPLTTVPLTGDEVVRNYRIPDPLLPNCHLLSNGQYSLLLTDRGTGWSRMKDTQITRWREDPQAKNYGSLIYLRDLTNNRSWSATFAPLVSEPDWYRVSFGADQAVFSRSDGPIDTRTRVTVSTEDSAEIRMVTLVNHSIRETMVEITSYQEIVLTDQGADLAHPAFSNLFVRTELVPGQAALLASRRPRSTGGNELWAFHTVHAKKTVAPLQFETARSAFLGRNNDLTNPSALTRPLTGTVGAVLDPIFSLRHQVRLSPGSSVTITFVTGVAPDREEALKLAAKYNNHQVSQRAFALAQTRSQVERRFHNLQPDQEKLINELIRHLVFPGPVRRNYPSSGNELDGLGQAGLWALGVSGDIPMLVVSLTDPEETGLVTQTVMAHDYLRGKGLIFDLVILSDEPGGYRQPVQEAIAASLRLSRVQDMLDRSGGIYVRSRNQMTHSQRKLLDRTARVVLRADGRSWEEQLNLDPPDFPQELPQVKPAPKSTGALLPLPANGFGDFAQDGREYRIILNEGSSTPAPWLNVLANPEFGTIITESGGGYTWAKNSREYKLTPWSNDPVTDQPGEVIWLRNEETGDCWTVTPRPLGRGGITVTHRPGFTRFTGANQGISNELTCFVDGKDPVKLSLLRLQNNSESEKTLSVTGYVVPVLGVHEDITRPHLLSKWLSQPEMLLVNNPFSTEFPGRFAFFACSAPASSFTADRLEFLGNNSEGLPAALGRTALARRVGEALDPCAAIQTKVRLQPGEGAELTFVLGQGRDEYQARKLVKKYTSAPMAKETLQATIAYWEQILGAIVVQTPDSAMNYLVNTWLPYQTLACRLWARSAFYQSGGAFGFRDQLQDAANIALLDPVPLRARIIEHAAHQYREGDVQHWWHPGLDRGVRTRFSDDRLWLPWAVIRYIRLTGNLDLLDEEVNFLESPPLTEGQDERYERAEVSGEKATVWEHCLRAIQCSLKVGEHGIPLMGSGDWNDGMNTVGNRGKGESVWLGWFLASLLRDFADLAEERAGTEAAEFREIGSSIVAAIEEHAWDGSWYKRAWFDDGTPLGSAENAECSIDSLAQSWAVISGLGNPSRGQQAMEAVEEHLVRWQDGLIQLFTPPFDKSSLEPGYIKSYLPGVRENGGQYTHAACWVIMAAALMGRGSLAYQLWQLISPVSHTDTEEGCLNYRVEPYVVAADVYSIPPHTGRGGWTWYTGASGWLWRVVIENILGFSRQGDQLLINPSIPKDWQQYSTRYRYQDSSYEISVLNPKGVETGVQSIELDGKKVDEIRLINDGKLHRVTIIMGKRKD